MSRSAAAAASVPASSLSLSLSARAGSSSNLNTLTSFARIASRRMNLETRRQLSRRKPPSTPLSAIAATSAETFPPFAASACS